MLQDERVKQDGRPVADLDVIGPQRYYTTGPLGDSSGWGGAGALVPSGHFAVPTAIRRRLVDHQVYFEWWSSHGMSFDSVLKK